MAEADPTAVFGWVMSAVVLGGVVGAVALVLKVILKGGDY
jgi:hypothetical protein